MTEVFDDQAAAEYAAEAALDALREQEDERRQFERDEPPDEWRTLHIFEPTPDVTVELAEDYTRLLVARVTFAEGGNGHAVTETFPLEDHAEVILPHLFRALVRRAERGYANRAAVTLAASAARTGLDYLIDAVVEDDEDPPEEPF